jgi:arsenate reductase
MTAHWGVADPAAVEGTPMEKERAFWSAFWTLEARIKLFACLPLGKLEGMTLHKALTEIGKSEAETPG